MKTKKQQNRLLRKKRIRGKVFGTPERPRLTYFKSNTNIYAQLIDDTKSITIVSASSLKSKLKKGNEKAKEVGEEMSNSILKNDIDKIVLDRRGFMYTGNMKIFADTIRSKGIKF